MSSAIRERWQSPCGRIVLLRGMSERIIAELDVPDAVISDPPYGIKYKQQASSLGSTGFTIRKRQSIRGDDKSFDPSPFLLPCQIAFFGAEHFINRLPRGHLLAWDKTGGGRGPKDNFIDAEFVWVNWRMARNITHHLWKGICASRQGEDQKKFRRLHVSQKPVRVMEYIIQQAKLAQGSMIVDPFMGSGSTGIAALNIGHRFTGVEIDRNIFKLARKRIEKHLLSLNHEHRRSISL